MLLVFVLPPAEATVTCSDGMPSATFADRTMPRNTETITGLPLPSLADVIRLVYPVMICWATARLATTSGLVQALLVAAPDCDGAPPAGGLQRVAQPLMSLDHDSICPN